MRLHKHFYVAAVLLAFAAILGEVYFRSLVRGGMGEVRPLRKPLSIIPTQLGGWHGMEVVMPAAILKKVSAEDHLRRTYYLGTEDVLELYIAYFGGIRGTAPHHPDICRPGAGYQTISSEVTEVKVPGFGDEPLLVHKDLYERHARKEVVVWWEYVHGKNVLNRTLQRLQWALPKFMGGRVGSVLQVQISHGFDGSMDDSMRLITGFMNQLGPYVQEVLPVDEPSESVGLSSRDERRR